MRSMLKTSLILPVLAMPMMACTTTGSGGDSPPRLSAQCTQGGTDAFIGQTATQAIGADIQQRTHATTFQWVPAGSAVTMDFRTDRVRVSYDRDMKITSVRCG